MNELGARKTRLSLAQRNYTGTVSTEEISLMATGAPHVRTDLGGWAIHFASKILYNRKENRILLLGTYYPHAAQYPVRCLSLLQGGAAGVFRFKQAQTPRKHPLQGTDRGGSLLVGGRARFRFWLNFAMAAERRSLFF